MRTAGVKRAQELVKAASVSIGRKIGLIAAEASLQNLLDEHELYVKHYEELEQLMMELLLQVPNAGKLLQIKTQEDMGGLLPGVDVESRWPIITNTCGLAEYAYQHP